MDDDRQQLFELALEDSTALTGAAEEAIGLLGRLGMIRGSFVRRALSNSLEMSPEDLLAESHEMTAMLERLAVAPDDESDDDRQKLRHYHHVVSRVIHAVRELRGQAAKYVNDPVKVARGMEVVEPYLERITRLRETLEKLGA
jgi:hypothetical protein